MCVFSTNYAKEFPIKVDSISLYHMNCEGYFYKYCAVNFIKMKVILTHKYLINSLYDWPFEYIKKSSVIRVSKKTAQPILHMRKYYIFIIIKCVVIEM